jgi:exosortase
MTQRPPRCSAFAALPWLARADALGLCAAAACVCALLWPQWRSNEDLRHGIFIPILAAILVAESRRDPSPRFLSHGLATGIARALLVVAALASLAVAMAYAAALGWDHTMAGFMASLSLVLGLGACWLCLADERTRWVPFSWTVFAAIALWILAAPPPPGTYARLAFFLQSEVTGGVVGVLNAFGVAADRNGNVIDLVRARVGVSEACSGVRSLISCTAAGLFLSALLVRRAGHRILVVALSPAIGLAMNFLRSLLLTLLVNGGVDIEGRWHDLTGGAILVVTTVLVAALALWLHGREAGAAPPPAQEAPPATGRPAPGAALACGLLLAAAALGLPWAASLRAQPPAGRVPDLALLLPPAPQGWTMQASDLSPFSSTLRTTEMAERVYSRGASVTDPHVTLYVAYWKPGAADASLVDMHSPDACWPGTGWSPEPVEHERAVLGVAGRTLPPAECRMFALAGIETRVWFWHLYGGRPVSFVDPHSVARFLELAVRTGFGPPQEQLFVRVSSNRPWEEIASEPTLRHFFDNVRPLGL